MTPAATALRRPVDPRMKIEIGRPRAAGPDDQPVRSFRTRPRWLGARLTAPRSRKARSQTPRVKGGYAEFMGIPSERCRACHRFANQRSEENATMGAILLWLIGIPIPIIIILLLLWH